MAASGGQTCNQCKWCHVVAKFNPSTAPTWVLIWRPRSPWGPSSVFGPPLAPIRSPFSILGLNACSHHLMWTIWLLVITQTSLNGSHGSLSVKVSSVIKNIQILQYFCQQKSFFFFNELPCFGQFVKYTLFGSPLALPPNFSLFRDPGPYRNRFGSLLGPNSYFRVPIFSVLASFTCTVFK